VLQVGNTVLGVLENAGVVSQTRKHIGQIVFFQENLTVIVDHIDGNFYNNNLENLRWSTAKENMNNENEIDENNQIEDSAIGSIDNDSEEFAEDEAMHGQKLQSLLSKLENYNENVTDSKSSFNDKTRL